MINNKLTFIDFSQNFPIYSIVWNDKYVYNRRDPDKSDYTKVVGTLNHKEIYSILIDTQGEEPGYKFWIKGEEVEL